MSLGNPLIEKFDTTVGSSTLNRNGKAWKKLRRGFFENELYVIIEAERSGTVKTLLRIHYAELIQQRGDDTTKRDFRLQKGMFAHLPKVWVPGIVKRALAEFENYIGDESKLENLQRLCRDLYIEPIPKSITEAKKAIKAVNVNIYDFLHQVHGRIERAKQFSNFWKLQRYSVEKNLIFPKKKAKADSALKLLLKEVLRRRGTCDNMSGLEGAFGGMAI